MAGMTSACTVRREESAESENAEPVHLFWKADKKSIHQIDDGNSTKSFCFDRVFTADETTNQLYQTIAKPLVVSTVEGYNGTIFAYGQTSSGKTFTMMGSERAPGVIPLAVEDVFQTIKNCPKKEFLLRVSYMEIYNETVTDLLVDSWKRKPLEVRETINKNIYVADLTEELVTSPAQALAWIRKGEKNRHYGKTKMNQRSSRSHTIFRMILESRERSDPASGENADGAIIVSHLNLVDLAGSERASQTGAEGARFKEGCNINRSLFTLGQVIKKLTDESQKGFTNYRDSKLTRILQNSLGGNAKTVIIGTITPVALDETLSTLQFASTAKKMKNDPHVTEVSDDGALLKRYRNEIVDLKRRLQEVSSVTQTTATEREVLSQLLQEKDQLQREQEDRIKNLTKLLVTSSNQVPVQKMPKRRVTWGGKMLRLAHPSACDGGSSDLSFAEPFTRKRKATNVSLMELVEDDEDFDSHWEIPDEPTDDMEISQSSVTVRSFGDSPKDFVSPDRMHELSGKVSNLQLQLQTEVQQKQEALEKVSMLDLQVADLERQLEEQSNTPSPTDEQMRKQFAEAIQLCETLASEKDIVVAERDYLKQELGMFMEQIEILEKEKAVLSKEMEEKRELDEFQSLEEEFRKEHELQRLTEELESVRAERDSLLSEREASCQSSTEDTEKLQLRVTSLSEDRDQLQETLEGLRQEREQLKAELEDKMETMQTEMRTLTETLQSVEAERDSLLCERTADAQTHSEEMEKLQCRVTSLSEDRDQLQETLEGLRQEKQQLRAELEDRMEKISDFQKKLSEQEQLNSQQQAEEGERDTKLQQRVQQLVEQLQMYRERQSHAEAEAEASQQLLDEANKTVSALKEQLSSLDQSGSGVKVTVSSRLEDSTGQLQESFGKFQRVIDVCSKYIGALDKELCPMKPANCSFLPKATENAYSAVCQLQLQTTLSLGKIMEHLQERAQGYRSLFEELVKTDLAVFEERRLQDVLLCRAQAPCFSAKDEDFHALWHHRLTELLDKRQLYLQKMASVLDMLWAHMRSFPSELSAELTHRETFKEQLKPALTKQQISFSGVDSILSAELDHRSAVAHHRKMILQGIVDEQNTQFEELKALKAQADLQLGEERSKSSTVLRALEGAPLKTELSLLKDNQRLVLQLQQTEEKIEALRVQNKQLEDAQIKANSRVSNHKQATQLLQTELQDSRAQVEDKENAIQALRSKLRESEKKNASPSAVELEKLQTKLLKMEVELISASDKHKQEIQQMNTVLNQKEESLRKLKETLRKLQQQGEESFLQGEDLHARLTNPKGLLIKSSVLLEKTKLEEEVKQLQLKIIQLESLVSSQQAEISKWKSRAIKLKVKSKVEGDKPPSPGTPTKRGLPMTADCSNLLSSPKKFLITPKKVLDSPRKVLDSPRKLLDSPKISVLDSPKSRFFDVGGSSDLLSRNCPKQFFDNSSLGTIPDAAAGRDRKEDWWPQSPTQEEMCKTQ